MILQCACCGGAAPAQKQYWNRDKGYGVCGKCAAWIEKTEGADYLKENYGIEGIHYETLTHK